MSLINHYYKYLEEYVKLTQEYYSKSSPAIFCDYYSLDKDNSVWDENYVASYQDIGELSGLKWNKVSLYPVFFGDGQSPSLSANEKGTTRQDTIRPSVMIPRTGYIEPKIGDFLLFSNLQGETLLYEVMNLDYSMPNNRGAFKLYLQPGHHTIEDLENVVSNRYVYNDLLDIILPLDFGLKLLNMTSNIEHLLAKLRQTYYHDTVDGFTEKFFVVKDLNYYAYRLMDTFPCNKLKLTKTYQEDFINEPSFKQSVFRLLLDTLYNEISFSSKVNVSLNLSITLESRIKSMRDYVVYEGATSGNDYIKLIYPEDYTDIINQLTVYMNYRNNTSQYNNSNSQNKLLTILDNLVSFEMTNDIPDNYELISETLLEMLLELRFFSQVFTYAIANKIPSL